MAWHSNILEVVDYDIGEFSVSILCKDKEDDGLWAFSGVYGPCDQVDFVLMWEEMRRMQSLWQVPWCVGGDLNVVRYLEERLRVTRFNL